MTPSNTVRRTLVRRLTRMRSNTVARTLPSKSAISRLGSTWPTTAPESDERDAVFEAGYTTAAEQGGTGLGLAFVQKLADVYGWEYAVTESAAGGARFEFTNVDSDA